MSSHSLVKKLTNAKERIEEAKTQKSRLEGSLADKMDRLKTKFKVKTIKEASALLLKLKARRKKKVKVIEAKLEEVENAVAG